MKYLVLSLLPVLGSGLQEDVCNTDDPVEYIDKQCCGCPQMRTSTFDVYWSQSINFPKEINNNEIPGTGALRQDLLGNFQNDWNVTFPLVNEHIRSNLKSACENSITWACASKNAYTFAYNIFDQVFSYANCFQFPDPLKEQVFIASAMAYADAHGLCTDDCSSVIEAFKTHFQDRCFDLDIAGETFNVMDNKFEDLTTLGYRITIPQGKTCKEELPHIAVYGKSATAISDDYERLQSEGAGPRWEDLKQNSYVPDDRLSTEAGLGPGTYDIYAHHGSLTAPDEAENVRKATGFSREKMGPDEDGMQGEDHLVRITLVTQSDQVLQESAKCQFTMDKIYLNEKTYNLN